MAKTLDQNSAYSVVHFIMFISLCLFLFIDSCYYSLFSLVLKYNFEKGYVLGSLSLSLLHFGGAGKVQGSFS